MKKILIAALAASSLAAGIGAAQADGTDPYERQLYRDRGAFIVAPEDPYFASIVPAERQQYGQQSQFFLFQPLNSASRY